MLDTDSMLEAFIRDTTSVSFAVVEGEDCPPVPSVLAAARMGVGFAEDEVDSVAQGTRHGGSKLHSIISVSGRDVDKCFGTIGAGHAAFCIRKGCSYTHQKKSEFRGVYGSFLFIGRELGSELSTVFSNPRVDKIKVPSAVQVDWLSRARPKSEWVLEFQAVDNMDSLLATKKEIKEETASLSNRETFKTPLKKKKDEEDLEFEDSTLGEVMFNSYDRSLPPDDSEEMNEVIATKKLEKGVLTRVVGRLETGVAHKGIVLAEVASLAHKRFLANERDMRSIAGAIQNSQILIGNPVQMDSRFEGPTLWSSTSFIADEVMRVGGGLAFLEGKVDPMTDTNILVTAEYILLLYSSIHIWHTPVLVLCIPALSTDTSTELYARIFRGCGNRIEKSVFPATPCMHTCDTLVYLVPGTCTCSMHSTPVLVVDTRGAHLPTQ